MKYDIPEKEAVLYEEVWRELLEEQSAFSKQGKLIEAKGCDHVIQLENPKIIVDCIRELL